jgi:hypothetical protein
MASVATDATNDVGGKVLGVRAVVLAVTNLAAVLAGLVFIVTKGTVKRSKFTQLVSLELVLAFGDGGGLCRNQYANYVKPKVRAAYRLNDLVNELFGLRNLFLGVGHDQAVKILVLVAGMGSIGLALTFLDGTLSSNGDLGLGLGFHIFQSVTTGTDE